ncbi:MAG: glycoside hydrolase family 15 protein [Actinomycetia bacterium]|nr:glycoside hydrolase family 15 protein [Actinomycetes bacterium]
MQPRIEDYAYISDNNTGALVGKDGSIDWLCLPRFDSGACFAALLGEDKNGSWRIGPTESDARVKRSYRKGTLILETEFTTNSGTVKLIDFMPHRHKFPTVVRIVEGVSGTVDMELLLRVRFDYGWVVPWARTLSDGALSFVAGPDAMELRTPIELHGADHRTEAQFRVSAGDRVPFVMVWHNSADPNPTAHDADELLDRSMKSWLEWSNTCSSTGRYKEEISDSLVVLKGLIYEPTGGVVAAATTSLPEDIGGERNWDYRYCWLRDASMTMHAFVRAGYVEEARQWRDWLLRAVAGAPDQIQIMYGIDGSRRLPELELDWLSGYEDSRPVRIGNGAVDQFQLDVPGEVLDSMAYAREAGIPPDPRAWSVQRAILETVADKWQEPDEGIWEVRGGQRQFVHSKVMAWVAADRATTAMTQYGLPGDAKRWSAMADQIKKQVCEEGFNTELNSFVQYYGADATDASLLLLPLVGFLPATDPMIRGTIARIEHELEHDGFVERYATEAAASDGLAGSEGAFLICSFWLIQALAGEGRVERARELLEKMLDLRNDVGLLAEEYDPSTKRMLGNFPQAFSHIGLVNAASVCELKKGETSPLL